MTPMDDVLAAADIALAQLSLAIAKLEGFGRWEQARQRDELEGMITDLATLVRGWERERDRWRLPSGPITDPAMISRAFDDYVGD